MTLEHNPYAAPAAGTGVIQSEGTAAFRPLGGLGAAAMFTIAAVIVLRLMILVGNVSSHVTGSEDLYLLFGLDVTYVVLTTVSGLLTITVIRRIQAFQGRRWELILAPETAENSPFQSEPTW